GGRLHQAHARAGAGLLKILPRGGNPARTDRVLVLVDIVLAQIAVGRGEFAFDLGPVAFQFFSHDHGIRGGGTLPHFRMRNADGDGLVRIDDDPGVDLVGDRAYVIAPRRTGKRPRGGEAW